jgi:hypothetical protein
MSPVFASGLSPCGSQCRTSRHAYAFHRWPGWRRNSTTHYLTMTVVKYAKYYDYAGDPNWTRTNVYEDHTDYPLRSVVQVAGGWYQPGPLREYDGKDDAYVNSSVGNFGREKPDSETYPAFNGEWPSAYFGANTPHDPIWNNNVFPGNWATIRLPDSVSIPTRMPDADPDDSSIWTDTDTELECRYVIVDKTDYTVDGYKVIGEASVNITWSDPYSISDLRNLLNSMLVDFQTSGVNCGQDYFRIRDYNGGHPENFISVDFAIQPMFTDEDHFNVTQVYCYAFTQGGGGDAFEAAPTNTTKRDEALSFGFIWLNRDAGFQARQCHVMPSYVVQSRFIHGGDYVIRAADGFTENLFQNSEPQFGQYPYKTASIDSDFGITVVDHVVANPNLPEYDSEVANSKGDKVRYEGKPYICKVTQDPACTDPLRYPGLDGRWAEMLWSYEIYLWDSLPVARDADWIAARFNAFWPVTDAIDAATITSSDTLKDIGWYWDDTFYGAAGFGATMP